jgi:hypothetical protein
MRPFAQVGGGSGPGARFVKELEEKLETNKRVAEAGK